MRHVQCQVTRLRKKSATSVIACWSQNETCANLTERKRRRKENHQMFFNDFKMAAKA